MVSLKDIARACRVSVATVSKALNGQPDIGDRTRELVLRTAEEMGYLANSAARALKTKRSYNIGVLFVDSRNSGLAHEYFANVLDSVKVEAERQGYDVTFITSSIGSRPMTFLQHCRYRTMDGVVAACVDFKDPMVLELAASDIPLVTIDHVIPGCPAVISDNAFGEEALTRHAASFGHTKIAFIHGEEDDVTAERLAGFHRACGALGLDVPPEYILRSVYRDTQRTYDVTEKLLRLPEPPTCILFPDDFACLGGYHAIRDAGLRIPEDISATGYDGAIISRVIEPRLTTWRQDIATLGSLAATTLIHMIERPDEDPAGTKTVPGMLIPGGSVAPVRPDAT